MWVSAYLQITLKDKPKDFRGLSGHSVVYAKNQPVSLSGMLYSMLVELVDYYCLTTGPEELQAEVTKLIETLQEIRFEAPAKQHGVDNR